MMKAVTRWFIDNDEVPLREGWYEVKGWDIANRARVGVAYYKIVQRYNRDHRWLRLASWVTHPRQSAEFFIDHYGRVRPACDPPDILALVPPYVEEVYPSMWRGLAQDPGL